MILETLYLTTPPKKLFARLVFPSMISYLFSSIYIIIDGIFVGHYVGTEALATVNLVLPILMIFFAVSNMIATGSAVRLSHALGQKDTQGARNLFSVSFLLVLLISLCFSLLGLWWSKPLLALLMQDDTLQSYTLQYFQTFLYALPCIMPLFQLDNYLRVCGKARYSMVINVLVSVLNVFFDWLLIVHFRLGLIASAYATIVSMAMGAVLLLLPFLSHRLELYFIRPKLHLKELGTVLYNGSSELLSSVAGPATSTLVNASLLSLGGAVALASYGIVMYIDTLTLGILFSIMEGMQPAIGYAYGAGDSARTRTLFRISCAFACLLATGCMLVLWLFAQPIASLFIGAEDTSVLPMTITALHFFVPSYLFSWFGILMSGFLTALGQSRQSLVLMLLRTCLLPLPLLYLLASVWGLHGVFALETVVSMLTFVVAIWLYCTTRKRVESQKNEA